MIFKTTKKLIKENDELIEQNYRLIRENEQLKDNIRLLKLARTPIQDRIQIQAKIPNNDLTKGEINHFLFEILKSKVIEEISNNFSSYVKFKPITYSAPTNTYIQYCEIMIERNKNL